MKKVIMILVLMCMVILLPLQSFGASKLKDVPNNYWAIKEINYVISKGVMTNFSDGTFKPNDKLTNAQASIMLTKALRLDTKKAPNLTFKDVPKSHPAYKYICTVVGANLISKNATFNPDKYISRQTLAKAISVGFKLKSKNTMTFKDVPVSYWSYPYVNNVYTNQIIVDLKSGNFRIDENVTRAQFAVYIARSMNKDFRPKTPVIKKPIVVRNVYWGMSYSDVKKVEKAPLISDFPSSSGNSMLVYSSSKYSVPMDIVYSFSRNKLDFVMCKMNPDSQEYYSFNEMGYIHDYYSQKLSRELGKTSEYFNNDIDSHTTIWRLSNFDVVLTTDSKDIYTKVIFAYMPKN
ncbi:S-layer homology domain-containing protein [Priestia koreensis]|uniref:SLH domain-containing protein n=1 Tax=Priestia koreensis TaxID=284581 RepID=A0A0M0L691_9BACI|nr:S-layer homology domain-containing protein [Priestia koreensis]KOO46387.1 hypothetical protein AMD01_11140 [Priestia koreensis]